MKPTRPRSWQRVLRGLLLALPLGLLVACNGARDAPAGGFRSAAVDRGDIRVVIPATGNLHAVSTVDVGAQVSGQVTEVLVDFNDRVSRDQVIAVIDPANFSARLAQAQADLVAAEAGLNAARANAEEARVVQANARQEATRREQIRARGLIAQTEVDSAVLARDQAGARVKSSAAAIAAAQAAVSQRRAAVSNAELDLEHTKIRAPVDGVVLSRTVQPGQTVAASFQTPVLFQIAEDLRQMELDLAIDEADIGQVQVGQAVSFNVDAYAERRFEGRVRQVRLAATNTSNVISYPVIVTVDNADQKLFPGMTANAEIEVGFRNDVLRLPNAALRFTPPGMVAPGRERGGGRGAGMGGGGRPLAAAPGAAERSRGEGGSTRGAAFAAELAAKLELTAEQRAVFEQALAQSRAAGADVAAAGERGGGGRAQRMSQALEQLKPLLDTQQLARLDTEMAARRERRRATVWQLRDGQPQPVAVSVGLNDGDHTELIEGPLAAGDSVLTGVGSSGGADAAR